MAFGKRPIVCKFGDLGEERSMYTQTNTLTGKSCTIAVHSGSLAFMVPELIIEELSIINNKIFSFLFQLVFHFCFRFCVLKVFAFLLTLLGLEVP